MCDSASSSSSDDDESLRSPKEERRMSQPDSGRRLKDQEKIFEIKITNLNGNMTCTDSNGTIEIKNIDGSPTFSHSNVNIVVVVDNKSMLSKVGEILKRQLSEAEAARILQNLKLEALDAQQVGPTVGSSRDNISKTCITHEATRSRNERFDQVSVSMDWLMNINVMLAGGTRLEGGLDTLGDTKLHKYGGKPRLGRKRSGMMKRLKQVFSR